LDTILKHAFEIMQNAYDYRENLHAMELFKDTHLVKLELLSNATTIDSALHYIRSKQQLQQDEAGKIEDITTTTTKMKFFEKPSKIQATKQ
jgi:hypothetical protein